MVLSTNGKLVFVSRGFDFIKAHFKPSYPYSFRIGVFKAFGTSSFDL